MIVAALGLALMHPGRDSRFAFAVGLIGVALAALGLVLAFFDTELGIDRWLAQRAAVPGSGAASFRVAYVALLALAVVGSALALSRFEQHRLLATALAGFAGAIGVFALLGYLTGIDTLYGSVSVNSPPLPSTVSLLCIAAGIILRIGAMPALHKPRPLWHLLAVLGGAIIAPLLLFGVYAEISMADAQLDQVRKDLVNGARTLSAEVDREIVGEIERLQALAASPSLRQGDFAAFQRQAEASLALRQSGNIMLVDRDMQQLVNTWVPFGTPLERAAVPEPAQRALATGKPQVTGLFMGPVTHQLMFGIIVPVQINGESPYVLVRSPNPHTLAGPVAANELPPGWHAEVSDAAHRIIARSEQEDAFIGQELPLAQQHPAGLAGLFEFIDAEGRPSLEAYAQSELTGWESAVWEPRALLEAPAQALLRTLGVMALLAIALVLALALWLGRIISGSVGHAVRAAVALGEGRPLLVSATPVAEVNTLMTQLRETASRRQAAEDSLRDSERQLRVVTDSAQVAIARLDTEARYKFVNRNYAERLGLTPERVIGKRIPEVLGENAYAILDRYVRECLAGNAVKFEAELPYQVGGPQFMHIHYEPEWRDGEVVGLVAAVTNITSLKRAEAVLRESEAAFRAMFDASSVGKIETDPESSRFLRANAAMCKFVGYSEAELLAKSVLDITHPDERDRDRELGRRLAAGESDVFDVEKRYIRKDGRIVWARTTVNIIRDKSGRPLRNTAVILDLNARKRAEEELHASKDRLQLALNAAQLGSWQYDPVRRVVLGDARCQEIFDVAADETPIEDTMKRVHPDDAERLWAALRRALDSADPKPYAHVYRVQRRDGEVRWVESHGLAYFEGAGPERRIVSMVGTAQDITERKEHEEKEHLLMREINHRAKNMLSVVDAIAHQTAIKNRENFIERFSERIQALSANQDLLVRNEWNGVEIEELVHAQLAHFAGLIGSRIAVRGPKLRLNASSAQAIGLALHELATNAGKYGALSTDRGRVDICWGAADNTFAMSWTERDGPPVSPPQRRGFGTIVMETMVGRSVDGAVNLDYAPAGLTWRLSCLAANALEPSEREQVSGGGDNRLDSRSAPKMIRTDSALM